jgi:hypothetical protein
MTTLNASQVVAEVVASNAAAAPLRVSQLVAEVIVALPGPALVVSQLVGEAVAANPAPPLHVSQLLVEVIVSTTIVRPDDPMVYLSYSDDRGRSFSDPVGASLGATGEYLTQVQWRRLGMGRDRVFEISWSCPTATALQGAWLTATPAES